MSDQIPEMTSRRPYLLRALHEWILDNNCSPYLLVDTRLPEVVVPLQHVKDDKIVLNLSPSAIRGLEMGDEYIMFSARFSGAPMEVIVPIDAILALYASENGEGMVFGLPAEADAVDYAEASKPKPAKPATGPTLGVVKGDISASAKGDADDPNGDGFTGFVHQAVIDQYLSKHDAPEDIEFYFCGPPLMNQAVLKMCDDWGVPEEQVAFDDFGG